jgi:uncharacterized protein HemX
MGLHTALIVGLIAAVIVEGIHTDHRIDALKKNDEGEEDQSLEEILNHSKQIKERLIEFNRTQEEQFIELRKEMKNQENRIATLESRIKKLEENSTDDWTNPW